MSISRKLLINRFAKVKPSYDCCGAKVKNFFNCFGNFIIRIFARTEGINKNRNRAGNAYGVCKLNFALVGKTCGNNVGLQLTIRKSGLF